MKKIRKVYEILSYYTLFENDLVFMLEKKTLPLYWFLYFLPENGFKYKKCIAT